MASGFNYRILVVDDEPAILATSAAILETKGYEVRIAVDGFTALAELRRALPNVIISDLRMPNMSGFELLSAVRRRLPHIPVIAISGEFNSIAPDRPHCGCFFPKGRLHTRGAFPQDCRIVGDPSPSAHRKTRQSSCLDSAK